MDTSTASDCDVIFRFYSVGDFGIPAPKLAAAMNNYALATGRPDCILGLGDNFYQNGVDSIDDDLFNSCWRDVYLKYETLKCPWHMVLGNHDYRGSIDAQIDYTTSKHNADGVWHMPARNYSVNYDAVDFFALDTNGAQGEVRLCHTSADRELRNNISHLDQVLASSINDSSKVRVVFAHHPMYTRGKFHSMIGRSLRGAIDEGGFGLEEVLAKNKVDMYITGHEHVFQYHEAKGVQSFVCGASCVYKFYGGEDCRQPITWVDYTRSIGFLSVEIRRDKSVVSKVIAHSSSGVDVVGYKILYERVIRGGSK